MLTAAAAVLGFSTTPRTNDPDDLPPRTTYSGSTFAGLPIAYARLSSTYNSHCAASKCIDGNANEGKSCNGGGSMCHSLPSTGPSLTLDLCTPESATSESGLHFCKGSATFDVVKIFNRVSCCKNRLGAFEVHTSNDHPCKPVARLADNAHWQRQCARETEAMCRSTSSPGVWYAGEQGDGNRCEWDESAVQWTRCYSGTAGASAAVVEAPCAATARYVKIVLPGSGRTLNLEEVQVHEASSEHPGVAGSCDGSCDIEPASCNLHTTNANLYRRRRNSYLFCEQYCDTTTGQCGTPLEKCGLDSGAFGDSDEKYTCGCDDDCDA